jgi:hypothetical protein
MIAGNIANVNKMCYHAYAMTNPEIKTPTDDPILFNQLHNVVGDEFIPIGTDTELESLYLHHQVLRRAADTPGDLNLATIDDLPAHEQEQIGRIMGHLQRDTGVEPRILGERVKRLGLAFVNQHQYKGKDVGGQFNNQLGLAIVSNTDNMASFNHGILHEVVHGLLVSGTLLEKDGKIVCSGNGIFDTRTTSGETLKDENLNYSLQQINEAVVDTTTLHESDLDDKEYLFGDIKGGYSKNVLTLIALRGIQPTIVEEMFETAFVTGLQDLDQAHRFAKAYAEATNYLN